MSAPDESLIVTEERRQQYAGPVWRSTLRERADDAWEGDE